MENIFWFLICQYYMYCYDSILYNTEKKKKNKGCSLLSSQNQSSLTTYSSVPNRSAYTFINFEEQFPPARSYLGLHVYWFWEKNPPCTYILVCTFIDFEKENPPARIFNPARLLIIGIGTYVQNFTLDAVRSFQNRRQ